MAHGKLDMGKAWTQATALMGLNRDTIGAIAGLFFFLGPVGPRRLEPDELEQDLDTTIRGTPAWQETVDLLVSVPSIGTNTARVLVAELPQLGTLDRRSIASLAGLAPFNRDSGAFKGQRTIAGGRRHVRSALYMAALVATRHNPVLSRHYKHLLDKGKAKKLALIAVARRLLVILNAIVRDKIPWQTT